MAGYSGMGAYAWGSPWARGVLTACVVGSLATGAVGCQPTPEQGLTPVGVALATDQVGTQALEGHGVKVRWLTCRASLRKARSQSPTPGSAAPDNGVALVTCDGRSVEGDKLRISGRVTHQQHGTCVRGRFLAEAGDRPVFRARALGDCGRRPTTDVPPPPAPSPSAPRPTVTETVTPDEDVPTAPVTVTVTATPDPRPTVTETVTPTGPSSDSPPDEPQSGESEGAVPSPTSPTSPTSSPEATEGTPSGDPSPGARHSRSPGAH